MKLSKKQREALRMMFGGKCAYCGNELNARWQADHVEPVRRETKWVRQECGTLKNVPTGRMDRPENDRYENLMPACAPCNNDKHSMSLESWRRRLEDLPGVCQRNHSAFRHALRFGLVESKPRKILFYFEQFTPEQTTTSAPVHPQTVMPFGLTPSDSHA